MQYHFLNSDKLARAKKVVKGNNKDPEDTENICLVVAEYEKLAGVYETAEDPKPEPESKKPRAVKKTSRKKK